MSVCTYSASWLTAKKEEEEEKGRGGIGNFQFRGSHHHDMMVGWLVRLPVIPLSLSVLLTTTLVP